MPTPPEHRLVHVVDDIPEVAAAPEPLVLVHALDGFLDAGAAATLAAAHLSESPGSRIVATFDVDELYDYRSRRPPLVFAEDHYEGYGAPRLVIRASKDLAGTPYLLLTGP